MKNSVFKTKTKVLAVIFASMALVGCGGGNSEPVASAGTTKIWTQISSQKDNIDYSMDTYQDSKGNIIVVVDGSKGNAMIQINDKPMPSSVTKCKNFASDAKAEAQQ